ncbi:alanine--glyoxylate aminotransferase family protein [bacterium]|nr:alanine--glyoxylate aminotransferase family protein [bacterium]
MRRKLFIPGPTEVRDEILEAMSIYMFGHRSSDFSELFNRVVPKVQKALYTGNKIFLATSSSTGLMEASVRNCSNKKVLNCMCGAFSDRWNGITKACNLECDQLKVEWGKAIKPEMVDEKLSTGEFDAITFVHNETSTGLMNPLEEIAEVMKKYPDVLFLVDAVSSMMGVKIEVDKLGIDVCLAGVQKCWALPPGLAIASVSEKAIEKSKQVTGKGYYFDFVTMLEKYWDKSQTTTTPTITHIYALDKQLDRIFAEGLDNRFNRHLQMANYVRDWANQYFEMFPEEGYWSNTVSCIKNTRGISIKDLNKELGNRGYTISNGYGKMKEETFRIATMGDLTLDEIKELIDLINEIAQL